MKWQELGEAPCSIARSLSVIGDRWTILILRNACLRTRRFDDFQVQQGPGFDPSKLLKAGSGRRPRTRPAG